MSNIYDTLITLLSKSEKYVSEDKTLLKNRIIDDAIANDKDLIKLLYSEKRIKDEFFEVVDENILIFNSIKFGWVLNNKMFLPDSYTRFANKIGLATKNDKQLSVSKEVVLSFPYKDCIFTGEQKEEGDGRKESFYNVLLMPDEITTLLSPKVFHLIEKVGEDDSENLVIKGNNLLALASLIPRYEGKVKCIYIDPPYNTGNDGFKYNDKFKYSTWLTFMKNRLELARRLLSKDGLIFVSIDTTRQNANGVVGTSSAPYLNVLMDEIFGRKNFIANLHWKKKKQPSFLSRVAGIMESILVYAKDESNVSKLQLGSTTDKTKRIDNSSNKPATRMIAAGIRYMGESDCIIKKGTYQNKTMVTEFLQDVIVQNGRTTNSFEAIAKYRVSQEEIDNFCTNDLIYITASNSFRRFKSKEEENAGKTITDLLLDWGQNQDATDEQRALFGITDDSKVFDNPKPEQLISNILAVSTEEGDLVLDFFMGSGTTAAVAHKMNRRYIGIEQMDYIDDVAVERLKKVVSGEQGGISKSVGWTGGGSFVFCELYKINQRYVDDVLRGSDPVEIYADLATSPYVNALVSPKISISSVDEFSKLSKEDQRTIIFEMLDYNQLYLNYSEIDDDSFKVSEEDKEFTKDYYQGSFQ